MKKMLLLALALLALGASVASAQSMNLAYGVCRIAATTGADDFAWPNSPCADPGNAGATTMIVSSFKTTATVTAFSLATTVLDIKTQGAVSDFWYTDPSATCHPDGLVGVGAFGGATGIAIPANCGNPYGTGAQNAAGGALSNVAAGRVHWEGDHGRNTAANLPVASATGGWAANAMILTWDDASGFGTTCDGCDQPACILLSEVKLFNSSGSLVQTINTPEVRNWVTFYGGDPGCPGSTPTKNSTWGQVKALYR